MRSFIEKCFLIVALFVVCKSASAVYTDIPNDLALLHCDDAVTNWWDDGHTNYWLITPDDNSSGRDANLAILNMTNGGGFFIDNNTIPALLPGSPYGGSFLRFDSTNSSVLLWPGWVGDDSVFLDFKFRWLGLPDKDGDNYAAVFGSLPWRCYFRNAGDDEYGFLQFLMEPGDVFFPSSNPILLASNVWYDVHFSWLEKNMILIVGNETVGYSTNTATMADDLDTSSSQVVIGYGLWLPRHFVGDLDEIRFGWEIPEPFSICLIGLAGFFFLINKFKQ